MCIFIDLAMTSHEICKQGHDINEVHKFRIWCFDCMQSAMTSGTWLEKNGADFKPKYEEHFDRFHDTRTREKMYLKENVRKNQIMQQIHPELEKSKLQDNDYQMQLEHMRAEQQRQIAELQLQMKNIQAQHQLEMVSKDDNIKTLEHTLADKTAECTAYKEKFDAMSSIFRRPFPMQDIP